MLNYENELFRIINAADRLDDELTEEQNLTKELIAKLRAKSRRMDRNGADATELEAIDAEVEWLKQYQEYLHSREKLIESAIDINHYYRGFCFIQNHIKK